MKELPTNTEIPPNARLYSTKHGIQTYHYIARNEKGVVAGYVLKIRQDDGTRIEQRPMTFDDVAGHAPASKKFGY